MHCYHWETSSALGGVRYGVRHAVGTCHDCGVGVCPEHGAKKAGQPLSCGECEADRHAKAQPGRAA
jgi:hypothetical protein